ncbi:metal-dependent transcriptional regulator (plasmid) [Verrucomicrobiaceae bacterium 227]
MPSDTEEDYLKAIYRHSGEAEELASLGKVASTVEVTAGTATTMMKQLARQGFVEYLPRKGVRLTEEGRILVMKVLRRHRLLELFLVEIIKFDWSEVHEEAEVLEHAVSDRLIDRIDVMLGMPARDPHGDPIPDVDGTIRLDDSKRLDECGNGTFRLVRVTRTTPDFLEWLSAAGLQPGTIFEMLGRDILADVFRTKVEGRAEELTFGQKVVEHLWVVPKGD